MFILVAIKIEKQQICKKKIKPADVEKGLLEWGEKEGPQYCRRHNDAEKKTFEKMHITSLGPCFLAAVRL